MIGCLNDISYGVYVYAFPAQQLLFLVGATERGVGVYFAVSVACTVPLAAASWYLVEAAALRWKHAADQVPVARSVEFLRRRVRPADGPESRPADQATAWEPTNLR